MTPGPTASTAGTLDQLSVDHSVAEELVAQGALSEAEAAIHPKRHILTRALGISPQVEVDVWEVVPVEGDRYLLCSDGLSNEVPPDVMASVLGSVRDPQAAAETLVGLANDSGGPDNITAVVVDVLVGEPGDDDAAAGRRGRRSHRRRGRRPTSETPVAAGAVAAAGDAGGRRPAAPAADPHRRRRPRARGGSPSGSCSSSSSWAVWPTAPGT